MPLEPAGCRGLEHKSMSQKIRVGILFGGQSAEHEISILSARNVLEDITEEEEGEVLLALHVPIERRGLHAELARDRPHGQPLIALARQHRGGGLNDLLARQHRSGLAGHGAF